MINKFLYMSVCLAAGLSACTASVTPETPSVTPEITKAPGDIFDLSEWNITLPLDADGNEKPDTVRVADLQDYSHPDFFALNADQALVFTSPNKATTTPNSSNTRSELRHMLRGTDTSIKTKGPLNNFALAAHPQAETFARVGGRLDATVRVNHVARRAGAPEKPAAFSAVVGQIHGVKVDDNSDGFGYGNEPIKIYYKKYPDHAMGSVFWNYERNLAKADPDRADIATPVFGFGRENSADPGEAGLALGEAFSYTINVVGNEMRLRFHTERLGERTFVHDLSKGVDARDNPNGYRGDMLYFKAGIYNQCSTKSGDGPWYAACPGTGIWETDRANGDYAQATFTQLTVGPASE